MLLWNFSGIYITWHRWFYKKQLSVLVKLSVVNVQNKISRGMKMSCIDVLLRQQTWQSYYEFLPPEVSVFLKCCVWHSAWVSENAMLQGDGSFAFLMQLSKINILKYIWNIYLKYICIGVIFLERNHIIFFSIQFAKLRLFCQRRENPLQISVIQ